MKANQINNRRNVFTADDARFNLIKRLPNPALSTLGNLFPDTTSEEMWQALLDEYKQGNSDSGILLEKFIQSKPTLNSKGLVAIAVEYGDLVKDKKFVPELFQKIKNFLNPIDLAKFPNDKALKVFAYSIQLEDVNFVKKFANDCIEYFYKTAIAYIGIKASALFDMPYDYAELVEMNKNLENLTHLFNKNDTYLTKNYDSYRVMFIKIREHAEKITSDMPFMPPHRHLLQLCLPKLAYKFSQ